MADIWTKGLPDEAHPERTYQFSITIYPPDHPEKSQLFGELSISGARFKDECRPECPEQEAWLFTLEHFGLKPYWNCEWKLETKDAFEQFFTLIQPYINGISYREDDSISDLLEVKLKSSLRPI